MTPEEQLQDIGKQIHDEKLKVKADYTKIRKLQQLFDSCIELIKKEHNL